MTPKQFTIQEVEALLPEVRVRIERLIHKKEAHARHHDALFIEQIVAQSEGHPVEEKISTDLEREIQFMESNIAALESDVQALRAMGCILKGLEHGCVDFPSETNGEKIYYCWRRGEASIRFFHRHKPGSERLPL